MREPPQHPGEDDHDQNGAEPLVEDVERVDGALLDPGQDREIANNGRYYHDDPSGDLSKEQEHEKPVEESRACVVAGCAHEPSSARDGLAAYEPIAEPALKGIDQFVGTRL